MTQTREKQRMRLHVWLIRFIGAIVPRRFRDRFRQEWEAELEHREGLLARWDRLDWRNKLVLLWRSLGAFWDALSLQRQRLEEDMFQDLRFGLRLLLKTPVFTFIAVLTLALGIGANTTIFSVANAVWLRSLPYPEAERLTLVSHRNTKNGGDFELTPAGFFDLRQQCKSFKRLAVYASRDFNLTGAGEPERLRGQLVSTDLFPLLEVSPGAGRVFTDADDRPGAERVALLSHALWRRRFGAEAKIIGQTLTLDDQSYTVVGVMPPDFEFPSKETELWTPIAFDANAANDRGSFYLGGVARLNPGVTLAAAQSELDVIARNLTRAFPQSNTDIDFSVSPLQESMVRDFKRSLFVLLGAVALVLLIACVNVANLLLARVAAREKELAVRAALGAGRQRLLRQLLTESTLLALCGGAVGLLLAAWGVKALKLISPEGPGAIPRLDEVSLDWRVLGFTVGVSCLTGVIFGLAPALQISKPDLQHTLKEGGRGFVGARGRRLRGLLVIAEIALSLALLIGAGLLIRSFIRLQYVDLGFNPERLLTLRVELSERKARDATRALSFYQQVIDRTQTLPGVEAVAVATAAPIETPGMRSAIMVEDKPDPPPGQMQLANTRIISPDYFRALGVPLLKGRLLSAQDNLQAPPVAIINQALARRYWGDEDPVGKRFKLGAARASNEPWLTVVGVVGSVRQTGLNADPFPEYYLPFTYMRPRWAIPRVHWTSTSLAHVADQLWNPSLRPNVTDKTKSQAVLTNSGPRYSLNCSAVGCFFSAL